MIRQSTCCDQAQPTFLNCCTCPLVLLLILSCQIRTVQSISRCSQHSVAAASIIPRYHNIIDIGGSMHPYRRRPLLVSSNRRRRTTRLVSSTKTSATTITTTKKNKKENQKKSRTKNASSKDDDDEVGNDPFSKPMTTEEIYSNIGPIAYVVAGSVEIAFRIVLDYVSAFVFAYIGGTVTDLPRFFFQNVDKETRLPFMQELTKRYGRMHGKSCRWGNSWGEISAAFGGFGAATRVLRGGREDQWNNIISSAAAGAYFARKEGPQAMARGALFYGAIIYLFNGGLGASKDPSLYNDQPLDF